MDFDWLTFDGVNWIGVLVAFVAVFAFGWVWYSDIGFYRVWQRLGKTTDEEMRNANMGIAFGGTAVFNLLGVILLAMLMVALHVAGPAGGATLGAILGFVLRGGAHAIHNGFALRDPRITLIDAASDTASLALAGAVLGLFS